MYARPSTPRIALFALACLLVAGCDDGSGAAAPAAPEPVALNLAPAQKTLALGTSKKFKATLWYSDGNTADVTAAVTWWVQDGGVASVAPSGAQVGRVTAQSLGTTQVLVIHESGFSDSSTLQVTPAVLVALDVTPTAPSLALGTELQLAAVGTFSDGSTQELTDSLSWSSSAPSAVELSAVPGSEGLCGAAGIGSSSVRARHDASGISGSTDVSVTAAELVALEIAPASPSLALGTTLTLSATGTFTDATTQDLTGEVVWDCDDGLVAEISNLSGDAGAVTTVAEGASLVTASHIAGGVVGSTPIMVTAAELVALDVTPDTASIALGTGQAFAATGTFTDGSIQDLTPSVLWSSSAGSVASVESGGANAGSATSVAVGTTTISAEDLASGIDDGAALTVTPAVLVSLEVTPTNPAIALGTSQAFAATGTFSDATTQDLSDSVTWSSSDPATATVSNAGGSEGEATSVSVGTTTIAAAHVASGIDGETELEVTPALLVSIAVSPADPSIALGTSQAFTATGTYGNATTQDLTDAVTWSSSDTGVATISNAGGSEGETASAAVGTTTIAATHAASGIDGDTTLEVTSAVLVSIAVTPSDSSIALGTDQAFAATGTYSDATTQDLSDAVTWSSSDTGVATISNAGGSQGQATSVAVGSTTIAATHVASGIDGDTSLAVTPAVLVSIAVTPADVLLGVGDTRSYTATGTYGDASTQDLSDAVTWSSSNTDAVTISNAGGSEGLATGVADGVSTISAVHPASGVMGATAVQAVTAITLRAAASAGQPSGVLALDLPTPTGTAAGDFMLAALAIRPSSATVTAPAGWTLIRRLDNATSPDHSLLTYRRTAGASEPAVHAFTFSASTGSAGGIASFLRVDTSSPIVVEDGQNTASSLSHTAPSVVTSVADTMLVTVHAFSSTATWTSPSGMSEAFDRGSGTTPTATGISLECNYALHTNSGATGTRTAVASNDADAGNAAAVALRRAP